VTREKGKNTAASVRARLLALAQSEGEDYQHTEHSPSVFVD